MEKKEEQVTNQMDIFTKGFVKPITLKEELDKIEKIEIEDENDNYEQNKEFVVESKTNDAKMKEKVDNLIDELEIEDEKREKKENQKRKRKNLILTIGIIIEIIIIIFLAYIKFFKETYYKELTCTNETNVENYQMIMENKYYFDKEDKVAKHENNITYKFGTKDAYNEYKKNYISSDIKKYKGIKQTSKFDDKNNTYENKTIYTYSKLKKNKNVTVNEDNLSAKIEGRDEPITIYIDTYENVLISSETTGFTCK